MTCPFYVTKRGYNTNEAATTMAQLSSQFASISPGMSTDTAQEGLVSIMKAWDIDVDDVKRDIMDNINTLGNNFAENNDDIVTGMEKASAALAATGTSFKDAFALFTGGQEIIQNAESMGTALRTISLRIHGYSEESTDDNLQLDDSLKTLNGDLIDLTKTASNPQGISTFTDETKNLADETQKEFKPLIEYLGELADAWDTFGDKQKSDLLQALFGKNRASQGAAIITNFDQVRASLEAMENAAGSSDREMEKIEGSISYKVNALKQTWAGFLQVLADRDVIKGLIDMLTTISELLIKILETPGLNVAFIAGLVTGISKLTSALKAAINPASMLKKTLDGAFGANTAKEFRDTMSSVNQVLKTMTEANQKKVDKPNTPENAATSTKIFGADGQVLTTVDTVNTEANTVANLKNAASNDQKAASENADTSAQIKNVSATNANTASTIKNNSAQKSSIPILSNLKNGYTALASSLGMTVGGFTLFAAGVAAVIAGTTAFVIELKKESTHIEDVRKNVNDLTSSYSENLNTVKQNAQSAQSLYDEYSKLAKGVDSLGNNQGLSDENFDRYNELTDQLAEKLPGLVTGWTDQNHAILECKDSVAALNAEIEKQNTDAYRELIVGENGTGAQDIFENYLNTVNGWDGLFLGHQEGNVEKINDLDFILEKTKKLKDDLDDLQNSGKNVEDLVKYANSIHLFPDDTFEPIMGQIRTLKYLMETADLDTDSLTIDSSTIQSWSDLSSVIYDVESDVSATKTSLNAQIDEAVIGVQKLADAYLHLYDQDGKTFNDLNSNMVASISSIIQSLDKDVISQLGINTKGQVKELIDNITSLMLNNPAVGNAIVGLFTLTKDQSLLAAEATVGPYLDALKAALKKGVISQELYDLIAKSINWIEEEKTTADSAIDKVTGAGVERSKLSGMKTQQHYASNDGADTSVFDDQIAKQQKIADSAEEAKDIILNAYEQLSTDSERQNFLNGLNAEKDGILANAAAAQKYLDTLNKASVDDSADAFNMTNFSSVIESLGKINTVYTKIAENIKSNKVGEGVASAIGDIEALRAEFEDLDEATLNWGNFENFDEIEQVLTDSSSSASEVQEAFDQLSTTLVNGKLAAEDYSDASATMISEQLQQAGITKESADAFVEYQVALGQAKQTLTEAGQDLTNLSDAQILVNSTLITAKQELAASGEDVANMTDAEILALYNEANQANMTAQQLNVLKIAEYACNAITISTSADIENLYNLMVQAGATAAELRNVAAAKRMQAKAETQGKKASTADASGAINEKLAIKNNQRTQSIATKESNDFINNYTYEHPLKQDLGRAVGTGSSGGGGSSKSKEDTKDEYVEEFEKQYEKLKDLRDNDKVDEYEYLQYLRALYEKFFKNKEKYAEKYEQYEREYLEGMKSLYDDVFSYLSGQIDKQIDKLNDEKSNATDGLKAQKTAAVNALKAEKEAAVAAIEAQIDAIKEQQKQIQKQIDAYQDQIDAINEANEARERELALQKALYELDKLQDQRTNLVYSESQGMHYESDLSGIRDAREGVQDAKDDIEIANIQKKIDLLNKEKDALDEQIDALEEQKEAIEEYYDNLITQTEEYWDNLIAESEAYYDQLVEQLEGQKSIITELQDALESSNFNAIIQDLTGQDVSAIFGDFQNFDTTKLESLKGLLADLATQYVSLETTMNADNTHLLDSFASLNNIDLSNVPNYLDATSAAFTKLSSCDFDIVKNGVEGIRTAFEGLSNDKDVFATVGQHLSTAFTNSFKDAVSTEKVSAICGQYGNALTQGFNAYFEDSSHTIDVGKCVTQGIGQGMISDEAKAGLDEAATQVADATVSATKAALVINSPSEKMATEVGVYTGLGVVKGMVDSLENPETQAYLQQFIDGIAQKIKDAFAQLDTSNLLDLSSIFGTVNEASEEGTSTSNIFSQMLLDLQTFATEFANLDMSPVVQQFTALRDAVVETSAALGGSGGGTEQEGQTQSGGTGGQGSQTKGSTKGNQQSGGGGSLTEAMQTFGDTATEVLGGSGEEGEEGEGSGVIGQFATLKTKVSEVTAAIGSGEEAGGGKGKSGGSKSGGKSGGGEEDGGTLIAALQAEGETAMNEETGIPRQIEEWGKVSDGINQCISALNDFKNGLKELKEFSITVSFNAEFGEATGTVSGAQATGSFDVKMNGYAHGKNVGLLKDERAVVAEQGVEGLVRDGKFQLIGQRGTEMMDLKKGDIIFSHSQTMDLLKNGKIHSRGRTIGNHAYADGTPLNGTLKFAGTEHSSAQLADLAAKLAGTMGIMINGIDSIERAASELTKNVSNVTNNSANQETNVSIGDIYLQGVSDTDGLAKAIKSYLPGAMLQQLHKT